MAGAVSQKNKVKKTRFLILRSLYYSQSLPSNLLYQSDKINLSSEIAAVVELKLVRRDPSGTLMLTDLGREYLFKISGNRKPAMIDLDSDMLLPKEKREQFIVRNSLAADIFRKVRGGE